MALLVDSRYKIPWIVWKREYSITVSPKTTRTGSIAHGLSFIPLLLGQWSINSNFIPSYDLTDRDPLFGQSDPYFIDIYASSSYVIINASNYDNVSHTFYFRLMAFAPPNYTGDVNPVDYNNTKFTFNSNYRYQKIYMSGYSNGTITHGLGYYPQARLWYESSGTVAPTTGSLTTTQLSNPRTDGSGLPDLPFYYHIYKDEF